MQLNPPWVMWRGEPLAVPKGYSFAVLYALCRQGEISWEAVNAIGAGPDAGAQAPFQVLHYLRKALPLGLAIETVHGWGIRLSIVEHPEELS